MTAVPATLRLRRESTLRSRAMRGDATAFAAVYERHHQALYRYCRSILRHEEDAQDALQSTMARAFAALQDERRDFDIKPWLFRIAHNEAISILRKRRATTELDDIPVLTDLDDQVSEREELRLLQMDLADLPDRQRAALVLRELNGLSHAEIAVVLETSAANVKQTIYEARTALFSAREGREMPCDDVRRMLSDGDGRVLRGRGLRAHLRSCAGCRRLPGRHQAAREAARAAGSAAADRGRRGAAGRDPRRRDGEAALVRRARDRRGDRGRDRVLQAAAARERGGRGGDARAEARAPAGTDAHRGPDPDRHGRRRQYAGRAARGEAAGRRPKRRSRAGEDDAAQTDADRRGGGAGAPPAAATAPHARTEAGSAPQSGRGKPADQGKPAKQDKPAKVKAPKAQKPVKPAEAKAPKAQKPVQPAKENAPKAQKPAASAPPASTQATEPPGLTKPSPEAKTQRGLNENASANGKANGNDKDADDD